jgi:nitroreductase
MDTVVLRENIRSFADRAICQESLRRLLQAAMAAHSAGDERPWHFVVIDDPTRRRHMAQMHPLAHMVEQAPIAILVCGDLMLQKHSGCWVQDCAAATEDILIEAQSMGLGAVWLRIYPNEGRVQSFQRLLSLPPHVVPFALTPIGHPAERNRLRCCYDESRVHFNCW